MSWGRDAWDNRPAKTKLLKSAGQCLIPHKVSKWWYPVVYVHLKETHIDGKVKIALTKRDQSKAKLFNWVNVQADLKNDKKKVNVWLGFTFVNKILQYPTRADIKVLSIPSNSPSIKPFRQSIHTMPSKSIIYHLSRYLIRTNKPFTPWFKGHPKYKALE